MKEFRDAKPKDLQNFMKELHIPTRSELYIHEFIYTESEIIIITIKESINPKSIFFFVYEHYQIDGFPKF